MNERILELADKAGADIWDDQASAGSHFNTEKFAELIVKECVSVVENLSPGYDDYRNQIEDAFRGDCVNQIKQHFGVGE